jgi:hypothetical protein
VAPNALAAGAPAVDAPNKTEFIAVRADAEVEPNNVSEGAGVVAEAPAPPIPPRPPKRWV